MKVATVVFAYNRREHLEKVLNALKENVKKPDKLYIFHDGKKHNTNVEEWNSVSELIYHQDWCDVEIIQSQNNKGLAVSIVTGLEYVFERYDAVIVLEDDCVPHPMFMSYMEDALRLYQDAEKVYSIGGCAWPVCIDSNGTDTYFTKRISSCGWATWKNRWNDFSQDYRILTRFKNSENLMEQLHVWGEDLERYLLGNIYGSCNSWAVFWALNVLENDGYCVAPYRSLIDNIGFDGSGEHSGTMKREISLLPKEWRNEFVFCTDYTICEKTKTIFSDFFSWKTMEFRHAYYRQILGCWMQIHLKGKTINDYMDVNDINQICIWGKGDITNLLLQELNQKIRILAIIESRPKQNYYQNIPILGVDEIPLETQLILVIPGYDMGKIGRILYNHNISIRTESLEEIIKSIE